jgi:hypothetical protein
MNMAKISIVAAITAGCLTAGARAQVAELYNPGFEIPYPDFPTFLEGWRLQQAGQAQRREIGDGLMPPAEVRSGVASVILPGALGQTNANYQAVQAEEMVPGVFPPVRNWPIYDFDVVDGAPITVSFWFMIPAEDPMVGSKFGLKAGFLRSGTNFSYYFSFDRLGAVDDPSNVDPDTSLAPYPGCTIVTLPDERKGIHTDGQWVQYSYTFDQQVDFIDQVTGQPFPEPPTNPAYASIFAARFGPTVESQGVVWVDDFEFTQGEPPCPADFDGNGVVEVPDIFAFLSAWFASDPRANFDGVGGIGVPDIFAFLSAWFAGCP